MYYALRDYALLREHGGTGDASLFDSFWTQIAASISISVSLFDTARSGLMPSDADAMAGAAFFADITCQLFPHAFGLSELSAYCDKGWSPLNRFSPNWQDGQYDAYRRGGVCSVRLAVRELSMADNKFRSERSLVTVNALGFYRCAKSLLAGLRGI